MLAVFTRGGFYSRVGRPRHSISPILVADETHRRGLCNAAGGVGPGDPRI